MAKFVLSATNSENWINDNKTEYCFIGRSNVGKSSLINALAKQKIAVTSKLPGRTRLINFYDFDKFRIVDLPGYGYANVNKTEFVNLAKIIDNYIGYRKNLYGVFIVVDSIVLSKFDIEMINYIKTKFVNFFIIVNKIDKIKQNELINKKNELIKKFKINDDKIFCVSANNNININLVFNKMRDIYI